MAIFRDRRVIMQETIINMAKALLDSGEEPSDIAMAMLGQATYLFRVAGISDAEIMFLLKQGIEQVNLKEQGK